MIDILKQLFTSDLEKLKTEISSYTDEMNLWKISGDIKNSGGNLCLHLCGNLQHFIGAVLGNSGYVRNRDAEFSKKNVSVKELVKEVELTITAVENTLNHLKEERLGQKYPRNVFGYEMTTEYFLIHLAALISVIK